MSLIRVKFIAGAIKLYAFKLQMNPKILIFIKITNKEKHDINSN